MLPRNVVSGSNRLSTHDIVTSFIELQTVERVEQAYFQSERAANSHAYTENIRLKNEGLEGQILGPELRGQAIEATRRLAPYGKSLRDAVDFYELHLKSQDSLRQIKLGVFVKELLKAKEEGKTGKKRRNAKPRYLGTLRYRLEVARASSGRGFNLMYSGTRA